jgi:octanoyl-[GcvH]:protein N-octanoyltransferase
VRLLRDSLSERPALDIAVSHALLERVARGELPATARLYRPAPTMAFGRLDTLRPGFAAAGTAAREHGFEPVVRLAGGHAAAYHEHALIYEEITHELDVTSGLHERFRDGAALLAEALAGLGVDARVGEVAGEYCPGRWSVNAGGARKLAGIGQRVISGGAHVGTVIVAEDAAAVREVLEPVYAALGLAWDPATVGAVERPWAAVRDAMLAEYAERFEVVEDEVDAETLALARTLVNSSNQGRPESGDRRRRR